MTVYRQFAGACPTVHSNLLPLNANVQGALAATCALQSGTMAPPLVGPLVFGPDDPEAAVIFLHGHDEPPERKWPDKFWPLREAHPRYGSLFAPATSPWHTHES